MHPPAPALPLAARPQGHGAQAVLPAPAPAAPTAPQAPLLQPRRAWPWLRVHPKSSRDRGAPDHVQQPCPEPPALPCHCRSPALTSKHRGASALAWLAMPMERAEPSSRTGQTLLIYQGRLQLRLERTVDGCSAVEGTVASAGGTGSRRDCAALPPPWGPSARPCVGCQEPGAPMGHIPTGPGLLLSILPAPCQGPGAVLPRARLLRRARAPPRRSRPHC